MPTHITAHDLTGSPNSDVIATEIRRTWQLEVSRPSQTDGRYRGRARCNKGGVELTSRGSSGPNAMALLRAVVDDYDRNVRGSL